MKKKNKRNLKVDEKNWRKKKQTLTDKSKIDSGFCINWLVILLSALLFKRRRKRFLTKMKLTTVTTVQRRSLKPIMDKLVMVVKI